MVAAVLLTDAVQDLTVQGVERTKLMKKLRDAWREEQFWPVWAEIRAAAMLVGREDIEARVELEADRAGGRHADFLLHQADGSTVDVEFKAVGFSDAEVAWHREAAEHFNRLLPPSGLATAHEWLGQPIRVNSIKHLTFQGKPFSLQLVIQTTATELAQRRGIEDELLALGHEHASLTYQDGWNRERIRRLVGPAREVGIKVQDIARMTGLSTQTLHTWMTDLMRPIPDIHLASTGPAPQTLEQSVLRTLGQDNPEREWRPQAVRGRIPAGWPTGSVDEIDMALERLVRWHMVWDGQAGYRVAPPSECGE